MENPTSFDLNRAIQQWRENLAQSPVFRSENLNELESHLRDSTATLQTHGLSSEEAFIIASKRAGKTGPLTAEFAKTNGQFIWSDRFLWILIGAQCCIVLSDIHSIFRMATFKLAKDISLSQEPAMALLAMLLPPLLITLGVFLACMRLRRSRGWVASAFTQLPNKPLRLTAFFFLLSVGFKLLDSYFMQSAVSRNASGLFSNWKFIVFGTFWSLPVYLICAGSLLFLARKRLTLSKA